MAIACLFALGASPVLAAGATHDSFDPTGDVIECQATTYTMTSGTWDVVHYEGDSRNTTTLEPNHVMAVDTAGNVYSVVGAIRFGGTTATFTFLAKLQIVSQDGGTADSANIVGHGSPAGELFFDSGTCGFPHG